MQKTPGDILFIAFIIILFWIGVWGLFDTFFQKFIEKSTMNAVGVYGGLIAVVLIALHIKPRILEHFV